MPDERMDAALVQQVWERAGHCCEYCLMPQVYSRRPFEIDHIIARKHHGATTADNLALSCYDCNSHKGPNIAGFDLLTRKVTPLLHPRRHQWAAHFRLQGGVIIGRSAIGRATISVLDMNNLFRVRLRERLIAGGVYPFG
jgi:hypothetical protein